MADREEVETVDEEEVVKSKVTLLSLFAQKQYGDFVVN